MTKELTVPCPFVKNAMCPVDCASQAYAKELAENMRRGLVGGLTTIILGSIFAGKTQAERRDAVLQLYRDGCTKKRQNPPQQRPQFPIN